MSKPNRYSGNMVGVTIWRIKGEKIDGSPIVAQDQSLEGVITATTEDGRKWRLYQEPESNYAEWKSVDKYCHNVLQ